MEFSRTEFECKMLKSEFQPRRIGGSVNRKDMRVNCPLECANAFVRIYPRKIFAQTECFVDKFLSGATPFNASLSLTRLLS